MTKTICIGPIDYQVTHVSGLAKEDGSPLDGWIRYKDSTISLEASLEPNYQRVVLLHEVIHGLLASIGQIEQDEVLVDGLAYSLLDFLQRNHIYNLLGIAPPETEASHPTQAAEETPKPQTQDQAAEETPAEAQQLIKIFRQMAEEANAWNTLRKTI